MSAHLRVTCLIQLRQKEAIMANEPQDLRRGIDQLRMIEARMRAGLIEPLAVRRLLQDIVNDKYPKLPAWYVLPEQQLEWMREINNERKWGFDESDFPIQTPDFVPRVHTELLLLAVYLPDKGKQTGVQRTIDEQLDVISLQCLQRGYHSVSRWPMFKTDPAHLRLHPRKVHRPGIRWVAYDYAAPWDSKYGYYAAILWNVDNIVPILAASEVFSALMLFPEYGSSMGDENPTMPGYQSRLNGGWSGVPYAYWGHENEPGGSRLHVGVQKAERVYPNFRTTLVREL